MVVFCDSNSNSQCCSHFTSDCFSDSNNNSQFDSNSRSNDEASTFFCEFSKSLNEIPKFVFESKNCMEWKLRTNKNSQSLLNGRQRQVHCCFSWIENRRIAWTCLRLKIEKEKTNQSWLNRDQFIAVFQESTELLPCTCFPNRLGDPLLLLGQVWPRVALELVRAGLSELVQLKRIKNILWNWWLRQKIV